MTDREKLAKLVCESINHVCANYCNLTSEIKCAECTCIADHLLANGVTFAADTNDGGKWISAEDWLPENLPENKGKKIINCIVAHPRGGTGKLESQFRQRKWDRRRAEWYWSKIGSSTVTHWMPTPEPPKEE